MSPKKPKSKKSPADTTPYAIATAYLDAYLRKDFEKISLLLHENAVYDMPLMKSLHCHPDMALPVKGRSRIVRELEAFWTGVCPLGHKMVHSYVAEDRIYFHLVFDFTRKGKFLAGASEEDQEKDFRFTITANLVLEIAQQKVISQVDYPDWSTIYRQIHEQLTWKKAA